MNPGTSIKLNSDFHRIYARGKSAVSPCVVIYCRKNRLGTNRFGFTVSKKLGKAVLRNRIRRRLREIVRLNGARTEKGYDLIMAAGSQWDESATVVAENYPDTIFCAINGQISDFPNQIPVFPKEYEESISSCHDGGSCCGDDHQRICR